jgi:hypothetical protein
MQRDDLVYAGHMLDMARKATSKVVGKTRADYDQDENLRLALAHLIHRRVSASFQQAHAEIPWAQIIGTKLFMTTCTSTTTSCGPWLQATCHRLSQISISSCHRRYPEMEEWWR